MSEIILILCLASILFLLCIALADRKVLTYIMRRMRPVLMGRNSVSRFLAAFLAALTLCYILPTVPHLAEALPVEPQLLEHAQIEASAASFTSTLLAVACGLKLMAISAVEVIVPVVGYPYGSILPLARPYALPVYRIPHWTAAPELRGWYTTTRPILNNYPWSELFVKPNPRYNLLNRMFNCRGFNCPNFNGLATKEVCIWWDNIVFWDSVLRHQRLILEHRWKEVLPGVWFAYSDLDPYVVHPRYGLMTRYCGKRVEEYGIPLSQL